MFQKKRKSCKFTAMKANHVDYKDVNLLKSHISESGKIIPSKITGTCAKFQRMLNKAIKKARYLGMLYYTDRHSLINK